MDFLPLHELSARLNADQSSSALRFVAEEASSAHRPSGHSNSSTNNSSAPASMSPASISTVQLPPVDTASFVSNKHEVNPAIALNLIQELHASVTQWQAQQRQVISAMRAIYAQGPMVDGWLQSSSPLEASSSPRQSSQQTSSDGLPSEATILRHGDADALMKYVESLENHPTPESRHNHRQKFTHSEPTGLKQTAPKPKGDHSASFNTPPDKPDAGSRPGKSQYWLCYLRDDGSVQSQLCPPEQTATVGKAIARFQKFKQLKSQQQALEAKLQQAVDMLTGARDSVCKHTG